MGTDYGHCWLRLDETHYFRQHLVHVRCAVADHSHPDFGPLPHLTFPGFSHRNVVTVPEPGQQAFQDASPILQTPGFAEMEVYG